MGSGKATRERILKAALEIFADRGFEGARMDKIASSVGINKASLYFYFKSKEDIFRELFSNILFRYRMLVRQVVNDTQGLDCRQRLQVIYRRYLEYNIDNTEMAFWNRIYYAAPEVMYNEIIRATADSKTEFINNLADVMKEGIQKKELKPMDPHSMAMAFYYLLTCIDLSTDMMDKKTVFIEMEQCFNVIWEGIKGSD